MSSTNYKRPEEILSIYKYEQVRRLSKWGRYPGTFERNWDRIHAGLFEIASVEMLAELVDEFQAAYTDGVAYGRGHKEE